MHCTERQTLNLSVMPFENTFHGRNTFAHIFTCLPSSPSNYLIAEGWTRCYAHIVLKTGRCILLHKHMKTSMTTQIQVYMFKGRQVRHSISRTMKNLSVFAKCLYSCKMNPVDCCTEYALKQRIYIYVYL